MISLLKLSKLNWWKYGTYTTTVVIVMMVLHVWELNIEMRQAKAAYENPKTVTVFKKLTVQGPTRIITRTIEVPGRKEVVTDELRGGFSEALGGATISEPVLPVMRTNRWLVGGGPSWRFNETMEWNVLVGRSFSNRVDIQVEGSQKARIGARVVFRF